MAGKTETELVKAVIYTANIVKPVQADGALESGDACLEPPGILILAGTVLNFFIVAYMMLCFGFVIKIVIITAEYFSYC